MGKSFKDEYFQTADFMQKNLSLYIMKISETHAIFFCLKKRVCPRTTTTITTIIASKNKNNNNVLHNCQKFRNILIIFL